MKSRQTCDIQQNHAVMFNYGHLCNKWCSKDGKMRYIDNCQAKSFFFFEASVSDSNRRSRADGLHKKYGKHIMNGRYTECITAAVTMRRLQREKTRRHRGQVGLRRRHRSGRSGSGLLLIRDAQMPGEHITLFEHLPVAGGSCDASTMRPRASSCAAAVRWTTTSSACGICSSPSRRS